MARIGFDGRDLLRKRTGVVNYTLELARRLGHRPDAELMVYADRFRDRAWNVKVPTPAMIAKAKNMSSPAATAPSELSERSETRA